MIAITRGLIAGTVLAGAAVGFASPASAEQPSGNYIATVVDGGKLAKVGSAKPAVFSPCGQDCTHIVMPPGSTDLHLQGSTWTGTYGENESFGPCTFTVDANTLDTTEQCPAFDLNVHYTLAKTG